MKFAYIIMAHDNIEQLKKLLKMLDYKENEIFLHIDKKSEFINGENLQDCVSRADLHIYRKFAVYWADISQTTCQIYMLQEASETFHDYYHLLSGHDLPIKCHDEILAFFEKERGKQFVHFESKDICLKENCRYYHFFDSKIKKETNPKRKQLYKRFERLSIGLQKVLLIKRKLYCGANWYSITQELADDFCKNSEKILKRVKWSVSSDEYVLQTFLRTITKKKYDFYAYSNDLFDYKQISREIDWHRGQPYVWRVEDYDYLLHSDRVFARKFDENIDNEIIEKLYKYVLRVW